MSTVDIASEVDRLRQNLLDLTLRNSLLNYRKSSARTLQIVDELPNFIFERLVTERKSFRFDPAEEDKEGRPAGEATRQTRFDLPQPDRRSIELRHTDSRLQTHVKAKFLEARLKSLQRAAKTAVEETGINYLHLAIGFLSWYAREDSGKEHIAPLILVPVSIERKFDARSSAFEYEVRWTEEEIQHNLCLERFLERDFGMKLPKYSEAGEEELPEDYFGRVADAVRTQQKWEVRREALLGFFSFHKLMMFADLDPKNWGQTDALGDDSLASKIICGSSDSGSGPAYPAEYDLENNATAKDMRLVIEADSSQHSALVDIANGSSLVIEGSPGTGKSQTITNAIANAMFAGKSVLFVAEKSAALNVVKAKLQNLGLGEFCLELHSDSATSRGVVESIRSRINSSFMPPDRLAQVESQLAEARRELNDYLKATSVKLGPKQQPFYDLAWRAVELKAKQCKWLPHVTVKLDVDVVEFHKNTDLLSSVAECLKELAEPRKSPWWGFRPARLRGNARQEVEKIIGNLASVYREWKDCLGQVRGKFAGTNREWMQASEGSYIVFATLAEKAEGIPQFLLQRLLDQNVEEKVSRFSQDLLGYRKEVEELKDRLALPHQEVLDEPSLVRTANARTLPLLQGMRVGELKAYRAWLTTTISVVQTLRDASDAMARLGVGRPQSLQEFQAKLDLVRLVRHPVVADRSRIRREIFMYSAKECAKNAYQKCSELQHEQSRLEKMLHLPSAPSREDASKIAGKLRPYVRSWFPAIYGEFREGKSALQRFWGVEIGATVSGWVEALDGYCTIQTKIEEFAKSQDSQRVFGVYFKGIDTDWTDIRQLLDWAATVMKYGHDFDSIAKLAQQHDLASPEFETRRALGLLKDWESQLSHEVLLKRLGRTALAMSQLDFEIVLKTLEDAARIVKEVELVCGRFHLQGDEEVEVVLGWLEKAISLRKRFQSLNSSSDMKEVLQEEYCGTDTSVEGLIKAIAWVRTLKKLSCTPATHAKLFEQDIRRTCREAEKCLIALRDAVGNWNQCRESLLGYGQYDSDWLHLPSFSESVERLGEKLDDMEVKVAELPALATLGTVLATCEERGLQDFANALLSGELVTASVAESYELTVLEQILEREIERTPVLRQFARTGLELTRQRFKELDRRLLELNRAKVAHTIACRKTLEGVSRGKVSEFTEMGLINNEIQKQKRHCRIRDLLRRAGKSVQALKPCLMMSPLSIAQYVVGDSLAFDLVIMDEASQIKPEDALGALLRAKQVVVVGDPKQLPPTSFFDRNDDEVDEEQEVVIDNAESVLEAAMKSFRSVRRLRWHYRSKHESLISFSNSRFYDGDLVVFPSPTTDGGRLGVSLQSVKGAYFAEGHNFVEAEAVAKAVVEHALNFPEHSLGVGAFNLKQSQVIEDLIDKECEKDSQVREAVEALRVSGEPLFVKNLENLQGDERDVMLISYTYGPDKNSGQLMQRFGPINSEMGWRRLNVLVTRARRRAVVFASFPPSAVKGGAKESRGLNAFKDYLEFCETGRLPDRTITGRPADSAFELSVARVIEGMGLKAVPQVGVAGYFIDIGVQARDSTTDFILGVECDGATYHSSKSARDRDRLREEVITSRGWKLHRVWSTDWYLNPEHEEKRLKQAIEDALLRQR